MVDLAVESYTTSVRKITQNWRTKVEGPAKKLLELDGKVQALQAKPKPLSAQDEKLLAQYEKEYGENRKKIEKANSELTLDLALITPPPPKTKQNAADMDKLPKIIQTIIKEKGVPIAKNVILAPDNVSFDFKAMKVKSVGFKITWRF